MDDFEEYIKKVTKEIREHYAGAYLDICFNDDSIMITNCDDIRINSFDYGQTWSRRELNDSSTIR